LSANESRPSPPAEATPKVIAATDSIQPRPADRPRFRLARVLDRRRASLELDRVVDVHPYPDPHEIYGKTPALARMLEAEAVQ
jgi:hypothetical protein